MYVCGPTVYNCYYPRRMPAQRDADTIRRYFEYRGYEVAYALYRCG